MLIAALLQAALAAPAAPPIASAADPFSQPSLVDPMGQSASLARAARGERLVVVVMKGTWCQVCVGQLERFGALESELDALETRVVGLTADAPADAASLSARLPWPVLSEPGHEVIDALDLWIPSRGYPQPALVVYDRCGVERARLAGRGPGWRPEAAVLELLQEMVADPATCGALST